MVQYYRDLCPKCSEILVLITELAKGGPTKNVPIEDIPVCTKVFQKTKELIFKWTILAYQYLSKNSRSTQTHRT